MGIVTCEAMLIEVVCDEKGISFLYVTHIQYVSPKRIEEANGKAKRSEHRVQCDVRLCNRQIANESPNEFSALSAPAISRENSPTASIKY